MGLPLSGRSILVVEDEPIIAMDVVQGLKTAGASNALHDGDASQICDQLDRKKIPYVLYSGYDYVQGPCSEGEHVRKPVLPNVLVRKVIELLRERASGSRKQVRTEPAAHHCWRGAQAHARTASAGG